mmetsp:Transcript_32363/g.95372  ORF Transcript_32363/g.95372 Transcript_32363/m.95372 type:complete len:372 (-) Transcript_32363:171-1286(-)
MPLYDVQFGIDLLILKGIDDGLTDEAQSFGVVLSDAIGPDVQIIEFGIGSLVFLDYSVLFEDVLLVLFKPGGFQPPPNIAQLECSCQIIFGGFANNWFPILVIIVLGSEGVAIPLLQKILELFNILDISIVPDLNALFDVVRLDEARKFEQTIGTAPFGEGLLLFGHVGKDGLRPRGTDLDAGDLLAGFLVVFWFVVLLIVVFLIVGRTSILLAGEGTNVLPCRVVLIFWPIQEDIRLAVGDVDPNIGHQSHLILALLRVSDDGVQIGTEGNNNKGGIPCHVLDVSPCTAGGLLDDVLGLQAPLGVDGVAAAIQLATTPRLMVDAGVARFVVCHYFLNVGRLNDGRVEWRTFRRRFVNIDDLGRLRRTRRS